MKKNFFIHSDASIAPHLKTISDWVANENYESTALVTFMNCANYFLIAHVLLGNFVVVTHEVICSSRKKIKIPNVCKGLNVQVTNTFEMLRKEKAKFVLSN